MSANVFEVTDDDLTESALLDAEPLRCQKPGCTNAVVKPARGRTPKFCTEHKRPDSRTASRSERTGKSWPRAAEVKALLNEYVGYASLGLALAAPVDPAFMVDAQIVGAKAPAIVDQLVELAKDDRNLRHALELITAPGKYGPLTASILGLLIPLLQNHKMLPQVSLFGSNTPKGGE